MRNQIERREELTDHTMQIDEMRESRQGYKIQEKREQQAAKARNFGGSSQKRKSEKEKEKSGKKWKENAK